MLIKKFLTGWQEVEEEDSVDKIIIGIVLVVSDHFQLNIDCCKVMYH